MIATHSEPNTRRERDSMVKTRDALGSFRVMELSLSHRLSDVAMFIAFKTERQRKRYRRQAAMMAAERLADVDGQALLTYLWDQIEDLENLYLIAVAREELFQQAQLRCHELTTELAQARKDLAYYIGKYPVNSNERLISDIPVTKSSCDSHANDSPAPVRKKRAKKCQTNID